MPVEVIREMATHECTHEALCGDKRSPRLRLACSARGIAASAVIGEPSECGGGKLTPALLWTLQLPGREPGTHRERERSSMARNGRARVTRANESIPTRHHRAESPLEEQSIGSSFLISSPSTTEQIEHQGCMCATTRRTPKAPAASYVQVLPSTSREMLQVRRPAKRPNGQAPCFGRPSGW